MAFLTGRGDHLQPALGEPPAVQTGPVVEFARLGYPGATGQIRLLEEFVALVERVDFGP